MAPTSIPLGWLIPLLTAPLDPLWLESLAPVPRRPPALRYSRLFLTIPSPEGSVSCSGLFKHREKTFSLTPVRLHCQHRVREGSGKAEKLVQSLLRCPRRAGREEWMKSWVF